MTATEVRQGYCPHCRSFQTGRESSKMETTRPTPLTTCRGCRKSIPEDRDCCPYCGRFDRLAVPAKLAWIAFPWLAVGCLSRFAAPGPLTTMLFWLASFAGVIVLLNFVPWIFGTLIRPFRVGHSPFTGDAPQIAAWPTPGTEAWLLKRLEIICPKGFGNSRLFGGIGS
jgi:hypothetical protein